MGKRLTKYKNTALDLASYSIAALLGTADAVSDVNDFARENLPALDFVAKSGVKKTATDMSVTRQAKMYLFESIAKWVRTEDITASEQTQIAGIVSSLKSQDAAMSDEFATRVAEREVMKLRK